MKSGRGREPVFVNVEAQTSCETFRDSPESGNLDKGRLRAVHQHVAYQITILRHEIP
jgi:hypothetical protein